MLQLQRAASLAGTLSLSRLNDYIPAPYSTFDILAAASITGEFDAVTGLDGGNGFLLAATASAPALLSPAGVGRLLQPLKVFHPEWVAARIDTITAVLGRFRKRPGTLAGCFGGAIVVQATIIVFYFVVAYALHLNVSVWDFAVVVPVVGTRWMPGEPVAVSKPTWLVLAQAFAGLFVMALFLGLLYSTVISFFLAKRQSES